MNRSDTRGLGGALTGARGALLLGIVFLLIFAFLRMADRNRGVEDAPERLAEAEARLEAAGSDQERYHALQEATKMSFEVGRIEQAEAYALEFLDLAERLERDWNYGNAIHDGNLVLGRVALARGDMAEAKRRLLLAGDTPGSPVLDSFGPNMALALDLIRAGERDVVVEYLGKCDRFWIASGGRLEKWSRLVERGRTPDFGVNLVY